MTWFKRARGQCEWLVVIGLAYKHARETIEAAGASLLFLPPYSPDFNPIEKAIAQMKALLKKTAARTKPDLDAAIAKATDIVIPQNTRSYFQTCGYQTNTM